MASISADPDIRAEFIGALCALADFLSATPGAPVPTHGARILLCAENTDDGGCEQVDQFARIMHATLIDHTPNGGHYRAVCTFGSLIYEAFSIPTISMALHYAHASYSGCVIPDGQPVEVSEP